MAIPDDSMKPLSYDIARCLGQDYWNGTGKCPHRRTCARYRTMESDPRGIELSYTSSMMERGDKKCLEKIEMERNP